MEKNISKIFLVIGITFLLLGAGVVLGRTDNQTTFTNKTEQQPTAAPLDRDWSDNFDSYETGSALHGQGGWAGWDNNAAATGYISDTQARSSPNSLEIKWFTTVAADMVQQYTGIDSDTWIYKAWQYVPTGMTGTSFFILMNTYTPGGAHNSPDWSLQLELSASGDYIRDFNNVAATLPLILDTWTEIRVEIDFEADIQTVYYGNTYLTEKSWRNGVAQGGAKNLACVDLYGGDTTSTSVYYDDMSVTPPVPPLTCDADGPYNGETGLAVQFTGEASGGGPPYGWAWTFGDGGTSDQQNPTHVYTTPGLYDVTLTVTDSYDTTVSDDTTANITQAAEPEIAIGDITGGKGISVVISNTGDADASMVPWSINLTGGLILKGKTTSGSILQLNIGQERTVSTSVFGIGKVTITVRAGDKEKEATGFVFLMFVLGVK